MFTVLSPHGTSGRTRLLLGLLPVVGVLSVAPLWHVWRRGYWWVVAEDLLAEWLTVLAYAPAAVLAAVVALRLRRAGLLLEAALFAALAVGLLFVAGEEVSWGQRQIGFAGPEALVEANQQGEANLHNLMGRYGLHAVYIGVSLYGLGLGRWLVRKVPRLRERPWLFAPQADLLPWFGTCFGYYVWFDYVNPVVVRLLGDAFDVEALTGPKLQEAAELAMAVGFLLFLARLAVRERPELPLPEGAADPGRTRLRA